MCDLARVAATDYVHMQNWRSSPGVHGFGQGFVVRVCATAKCAALYYLIFIYGACGREQFEVRLCYDIRVAAGPTAFGSALWTPTNRIFPHRVQRAKIRAIINVIVTFSSGYPACETKRDHINPIEFSNYIPPINDYVFISLF